MNEIALERAGVLLAAIFGARVFAKWRVSRREREALAIPLVDPILLETLFAARAAEGDDPALLAELRDTLLHLNRRAYAEEFWGLHTQLAALYDTLAQPQQATMRRAILRLIAADNRWLQLVGTKTAAALEMREAIPSLRTLLEPSEPSGDDRQECAMPEAVEKRYREEIEQALEKLAEPAPPKD